MKEAPQLQLETRTKSQYSVEFECIAKFLAYFEDVSGLTDRQIVAKALQIANGVIGPSGSLMVERTSKSGSFAISTLGVERLSAQILGKPAHTGPTLRVVK